MSSDPMLDDFGEGFDVPDEQDDAHASFTANGRTYVISITKARLDLYEQRHKPIMAVFLQNGGAFSVKELTDLMAYGLREEGGAFVNPRKGAEMAARIMEANGYADVFEAVFDALERDCGFLFKGR